jgi:hypothetical protein
MLTLLLCFINKLNLLLSLLYNCLSIPLAAGVFYPMIHARIPPTIAAIAMALSSISVVGSSLALRFYRAPRVVAQEAPSTGRPRATGRMTTVVDNEDLMEPLMQQEPTERTANLNLLEEGEE